MALVCITYKEEIIMDLLSIASGVLVFCMFIAFFIYTGVNIKQNDRLRKAYKIAFYLGLLIIAAMALTGIVAKEINVLFTLIFMYYLKSVYCFTFITGVFFGARSFYFKMKSLCKTKTA